MIFKSISYWIWFALFVILALVLTRIPLLNVLAFEFCAILAIGISLAGAHIATTCVKHLRHSSTTPEASSFQVVVRLFAKSFGTNLLLLITPLIVILLNALRVKNCDFLDGGIFFLLLPVISCAYSTGAGVFFGLWFKKRWTAYFIYLVYIFATLLPLLHNLAFHPPVFGYHSTFGYFPGPIYDEYIPISLTLIIARGTTLVLTGIFLLLAIAMLSVKENSESPPTLRLRNLYRFKIRFDCLTHRLCLVAMVVAFGSIYLHRSELGLRPTRSYIEKTLGGMKETEHFKLYYEKGSRVEQDIEWIAHDHEFRHAQLTTYFQMQPSKKTRSYIYTTPDQKKQLIGARETSVEDPFAGGFHINYEDFPHPVMKHELAHAFTADWHPLLKVSLKPGLHEGIAVAAAWNSERLTPHQRSKAMHQLKIAPEIQQIMGLGFWKEASSRSYTLAGSFVRFLVDSYGMEKFKDVFPTGNFKQTYGKTLTNLVQEWKGFLESVPLTKDDLAVAQGQFKHSSIFQKMCAHKIAELSTRARAAYRESNFTAAIPLFEEISKLDPDNLFNLLELMYTHYQMEDYHAALELTTEISTHPGASVKQIAEAKNVEGDVYWQQGKRNQAISYYQQVFALHASHAYDREVQAKLAILALDFVGVKDKLRQVLISQSSPQLKVTLLQEVINELPEWGLPHYLIGTQLERNQKYVTSNRYRFKANSLGLPHQSLEIENVRLIGVNSYRLGHYDAAIEQLQRITARDNVSLGIIYNAREWIERCDWAKGKMDVGI